MSKPQQNSPWVYIALSVVAVLGIGVIVYMQMHRTSPQSPPLADADVLVAPQQSQTAHSTAAITPQIAAVSSTTTPAGQSPSQSKLPVVPSKAVPTAVPAKITPIATSQMLPQPAASESAYKLKRDPYPLPGEEFGKPLKPTLLGEANDGFAAGGQLQAKPGQIIPWNHARQYVGQTITVEGKVVLTNKTKTVCFLNFVENWRGRFYVVIFEKVLGSWPQSPEQYFLHKTIRVTGEVKDRRGTPQIQITDPKQIQIVTIPE